MKLGSQRTCEGLTRSNPCGGARGANRQRAVSGMKRAWAAAVTILFLAGAGKAQQYGAPETDTQAAAPASASVAQGETAVNNLQNPLFGGVTSGPLTPGVMPLSLADTVHRALQYNLALLLSSHASTAARGARWVALSELLPHVTAGTSETVQQINLQAFGFPGFPGVPKIVGPFSVFDVRGHVSQQVFNLQDFYNARSSAENLKAARYSYRDARDLVVLVAVDLYLEADTGASRVKAAHAEVQTAQALYQLAVDRHKAGLAAGIDVLRAHVELEGQQQRLIYDRNEYEEDKLTLERAIGIAAGQKIELTNPIRYENLPPITLQSALARAYQMRADYKSAEAQLAAAKAGVRAARARRLPTLSFNGNYGDIGIAPGVSHGTFSVAGTLSVPLFQGGRIKGQELEAESLERDRQAQLANLRNQIDYEVRTAFLDMESTSQQVQVATSALTLAKEQLQQARDRFAAGVVNSLEVVQSQEALATADENYISSLYSNNVAKASLARAVGGAERTVEQFLLGMSK